jgi:hypothetical protein
MATPPLPSLSATPSEVRTYFTTLLTTLHFVSEPEAQEIAAKWRIGRGSELRSYDLTIFREIFGVEAGTVLFDYVKSENGPASKVVGSKQSGFVRKQKPDRDIFGFTPGCEFYFQFLITA